MKITEQEKKVMNEATRNIYKVAADRLFGKSYESPFQKDEASYLKIISTIDNYKED